jgi:hypothetical protein
MTMRVFIILTPLIPLSLIIGKERGMCFLKGLTPL